jgi:multiple sugar transport system permease protein
MRNVAVTQRSEQDKSVALPARSRSRPLTASRRNRVGLLFVAPTLILLITFVLLPTLGAIGLSFTDWALVGSPKPVGAANYNALLSDRQFIDALIVTFQVGVGIAVPSTLLALALAIISDSNLRFASAYQSIIFFPVVLPSVVTTIIWGVLYQKNGVINGLLGANIAWLTDSHWALPALIMLMIWTNLGYYTVIMVAGVKDIPRECLDAASVDGAGAWQRFIYITLPLVRPVLLFVAVIAATDALNLFVQPFLLTGGGPADATRTLSELIYETAFQYGRAGKASAMAVVLLLLASVVALIQFRLLRRITDET